VFSREVNSQPLDRQTADSYEVPWLGLVVAGLGPRHLSGAIGAWRGPQASRYAQCIAVACREVRYSLRLSA
jgi:hypothetical protein